MTLKLFLFCLLGSSSVWLSFQPPPIFFSNCLLFHPQNPSAGDQKAEKLSPFWFLSLTLLQASFPTSHDAPSSPAQGLTVVQLSHLGCCVL